MTSRSPTTTEAQTALGPLTGIWVNQLQSRLTIDHDPSGSLRGSYVSAVGDLAGIARPLVGLCDEGLPGGDAPLGFVVRWAEDHSVTCWSGRYDPGSDEITAMWLLTSAASDREQDWRSTLTGQDKFRRMDADRLGLP